jgi:Flp pilus assembly protein TadG
VRSRGSTAVEFAFIFPIAIAVMFGAIEMGRLVMSRQMLTYATMEGVRVAASMGTLNTTAVQDAVIAAAPMLSLTSSNIAVTAALGPPPVDCASWAAATYTVATYGTRSRATRDCAQVVVTYTFQPVLGVKWWTSHAWVETQTMEVF